MNPQTSISGNHPTTADNLLSNTQRDMTSSQGMHRQQGIPSQQGMASGQGLSGNPPTTAEDTSRMKSNDQFTSETMSSTRSEYGSDNSSHHSQANRPVADKDAFIQPHEPKQHWQTNMSPAERAKKLADEMDKSLEQRRASAGEGDKMLKIGGKKEYKLD